MRSKTKHPCMVWWIIAGLLLAFGAFVPTYFYVRLLPVLMALVIGCYCRLFALKKKHPKAARILKTLLNAGVICAVLIFTVTGSLILKAANQVPETDLPYILVLGAQVRDNGPSDSLQERIDAACDYLTANPGTIAILSGGQGSDEPTTEAQCMFDCLVAKGIDPQRLIKEEQATSTWGNLHYSLQIIEAQTGAPADSIGVVSSEFHLCRVGLQAKEFDLQIRGIPAKTGNFDRWLHYFVREIAGIWHYLLLGGSNR